jgi:hypothetical protein
MYTAIGIFEAGTVIFCGFAVALLLEWVSLELLMKMMPARVEVQTTAQKFAAIVNQAPRNQAGRKAA